MNTILTRIVYLCLFGIGISCIGIFVHVNSKFKIIRAAFDEKIIIKKEHYHEDVDDRGNAMQAYQEAAFYNRVELENNRKEYNKTYAKYVIGSQLVAVLPLLGILGTVLGLAFSDMSDVQLLLKGLGTALNTTIVGLVFSIPLKIFDACRLGWYVNTIDSAFSTADDVINRDMLVKGVVRESSLYLENKH